MKSQTVPSFWDVYYKLDQSVRDKARKTYKLWAENPFHPSLHFKCVNQEERIWSARITIAYRAVGVLDGDTVAWFWIGSHDDYENYFG